MANHSQSRNEGLNSNIIISVSDLLLVDVVAASKALLLNLNGETFSVKGIYGNSTCERQSKKSVI